MNKITLPVLRNIEETNISNENDTLKSILPKLEEEYKEFIETIIEDHEMEHKLEEYFDLLQTCVRLGKVFDKMGIDLEKASKSHYEKLKNRKWVIDGHVDIFYAHLRNI